MKISLLLFTALLYPCIAFAQISDSVYEHAVGFCIKQLTKGTREIPAGKYPIRTEGVGPWELTESSTWTSGFFPGCLWYGYKLHPRKKLLENAKKFTEGLEDQQFNTGHHDIGFMILSSYGNGFKIANKSEYRKIILQSAASLSSRYNSTVGCIQSWNGDFQVIIDNMMNLELLFWAAKHGGDKKFYNIAVSHAYKTIQNHIREDGSSFHVVVYDTATGKVIKKRTAQGYSDSSAWARGQAWGIYGFTMCYRETLDSTFLKTAIKMAHYFIKNLPQDYVPFWDFRLPPDSVKKFKDASAATIACSGLLELRNYVEDASEYDLVINRILFSLINNYLAEKTNSSGIILHCAYNVNNPNPFDWDASSIWGDYYFLESLIRYKDVFK
jgi:unsaturated chondroitin disaccharide hydrolase